MAIYAISDLHLAFGQNKPMDIFGENWKQHEEKIKKDWQAKVKQTDLVLLPGDFSWAMHLKDTYQDFQYLEALPGRKLLLKGNHDYWWDTVTKMRRYIEKNQFNNIDFLYNNSYEYQDYIICGTRGWKLSGETEEDKKIRNREIARLQLSLQDGIKRYGTQKQIIVCMHYPPIRLDYTSPFITIMKEFKVKKCIYGHLHGVEQQNIIEGIKQGIDFTMVSCDYTNFKLIKLVNE